MHTKEILILTFFFFLTFVKYSYAQESESTFDYLKKRKKEKQAQLDSLNKTWKPIKKEADKIQVEIKLLEDSLKVYPIWKKGIFGTVGFNFTRFSNWLSKKESNTSASTIGYTVNAFINLEERKYFWRNSIKLHQSWLKFDNKEIEEEQDSFQVASDIYNFHSIWGYKFSEKLAASALTEYKTALLQGRWNNPGFLDIGIGMSWTPTKNVVIAVHPINYNAVFSKQDLKSSFGVKTIAEVNKNFKNKFSWNSSFSSFLSYKDKMLNNWSWTNGLSKTFKWIGVGLDIAFKQNRQEAIARKLEDNPFQFYYILGLSYKF